MNKAFDKTVGETKSVVNVEVIYNAVIVHAAGYEGEGTWLKIPQVDELIAMLQEAKAVAIQNEQEHSDD